MSVDPFSPTPFSVGFDPGTPVPAGTSLGHVQLAQQIAPLVPQVEPMSLLKDLVGVAAPLVGAWIGGPAGAAVGTAMASLGSRGGPAAMPGGSPVATMGSTLPAIGTAAGAVVGTTVRAGIAGARAIMASARYYCAKYPTWCISIGGLGAVQGMVQGGQLPVHRKRRGRGISARDFRGFRRVHNILSGFCAPRMRIKRRALGKR